MRCSIIPAIAFALLSSSAIAFEIKMPDTNGFALAIDQHNRSEIKAGFQLSLNKRIATLPSKDLEDYLKSLDLKSASGKTIEDFLIDLDAGIAIGFADQKIEPTIVRSKQTPDGLELIITGSDDKGLRIISPLDIGVYSFDGSPNPFTAVPYTQAPQQIMRVAILLDVSGSMAGSIIELQEATVSFLKELSGINQGILCRLTTFNSDFKHSGGFVPCGSLTGEIARLRAGGGTELQAPLLSAYQALGKYEDPAAILIITDGNAPIDMDILLKAKSATTHALWLGNSFFSRGKYQKLIDTNLYRTGGLKQLGQSFYSGFAKSIRSQLVLTIPTKSSTN